MDGTQQLVAVGGLGLVGVNFWTGRQRPAITGVLWGTKGADAGAGHQALLGMAGELLLVGILVLVAGQSDSLATGMAAVVAALWVLWAMHYYGGAGGASHARSQAPTAPASSATQLA